MEVTREDLKFLCKIIDDIYLPKLRNDIDNRKDEKIESFLKQRYRRISDLTDAIRLSDNTKFNL